MTYPRIKISETDLQLRPPQKRTPFYGNNDHPVVVVCRVRDRQIVREAIVRYRGTVQYLIFTVTRQLQTMTYQSMKIPGTDRWRRPSQQLKTFSVNNDHRGGRRVLSLQLGMFLSNYYTVPRYSTIVSRTISPSGT